MPLEDNFPRTSMATILHRLEDFSFEPKKGACRSCRVDYNTLVENASRKTLDYFDGMCLDCMDRTKPVTKDEDMDYWYHKNLNQDYFTGRCRVKHGQPTWYFSFMGRKIIRDRFLRKKGALFGSRDSDSD